MFSAIFSSSFKKSQITIVFYYDLNYVIKEYLKNNELKNIK